MLQDNTTKWKVRKFTDFASNQALPVGFMYQHLSPIVPVGSLPLLGGTYDRTLYADLWSWANENGLVVSEAEWQSMATAQGGSCSKFSDGNGSTTFRVPALKCWVKGANGVEEVGNYLEAGLPNVTGRLELHAVAEANIVSYGSGSLLGFGGNAGSYRTPNNLTAISGVHSYGGFSLDASRSSSIYGNSDTVQPPSLVGMWLIVAFSVATNVGEADVANVMQAVERVQGRVQPIELGGTSATTYKDAISNLHSVGVFTRSDVGNTLNIDDPGINGLLEVRGSEIPITGSVPSNGYYPLLNLKTPDNIAMLQIAGVGGDYYIRGRQSANVNLANVAWSKLVTSDGDIDYIVESYNDGKNWYEVYKSGKVRQGSSNCTSESSYFVCNLFKPFANTDYTLMATGGLGTHTSIDGNNNDLRTYNKQTTVFCVYNVHSKLDWVAEGKGV